MSITSAFVIPICSYWADTQNAALGKGYCMMLPTMSDAPTSSGSMVLPSDKKMAHTSQAPCAANSWWKPGRLAKELCPQPLLLLLLLLLLLFRAL